MLSALARIDHALRELGQPGLSVTVFDPDEVTRPNIGRQLFTAGDLGYGKAECLVTRFNRLFGNDWRAVPEKYSMKSVPNIIVSCVDNTEARLRIAEDFRAHNLTERMVRDYRRRYGGVAFNQYNENYCFYWLDLGNAQRTGQAFLGSNRIPQPDSGQYDTVEYLPLVSEVFDLTAVKEEDSGPSCSMAEALSRQDLFINSVLVQTAASLLWSLLTDVAIDTRGFFVNLDTYRTAPVPVLVGDVRLLPAALRPRKNGRRRKKD